MLSLEPRIDTNRQNVLAELGTGPVFRTRTDHRARDGGENRATSIHPQPPYFGKRLPEEEGEQKFHTEDSCVGKHKNLTS